MEKNKFVLIAGAALAAFSFGSVQASSLTKTVDLSSGVLVAENDEHAGDAKEHEEGDHAKEHGKKGAKKGKKKGGGCGAHCGGGDKAAPKAE